MHNVLKLLLLYWRSVLMHPALLFFESSEGEVRIKAKAAYD